jgi:RNA polymerase sigma-B factor
VLYTPQADRSTEDLITEYARRQDPQLRTIILERHTALVRSLAHKFVRTGVPVEDLVQCGWVALIGAFDRFDPVHGTRFSTYAVHCIVGEIKRYFRDKTWSMKVPRHLQEIAANLNGTHERLLGLLGREPSVGEMAAALSVSEEMLLAAMDLGHAYTPAGLDDRREMSDGNEGMTLGDSVGGFDPDLLGVVENAPLRAALAELDPRDQRILEMRFFEGRSQQEVADEVGVSQMQISRLERRSLQRLREILSRPA